jgi:hypothetical protein
MIHMVFRPSGRFFILAVALAASSAAQPAGAIFKKAPPEVESALRARIKQFVELQQQKKYRQAEALVCEESKDEYYGSPKKPLDNWELSEIAYEEGHSKASAIIVLDSVMTTVGGVFAMKQPWATRWKVENGAWCVYFPDPLIEGRKTPFGVIQANERKDVADPAVLMQNRPRVASFNQPVKLSKALVTLNSAAKSSDEIEVANALPGPIRIEVVQQKVPGLSWDVTPAEVAPNSKGTVKFLYDPPNNFPKSDVQMNLLIQPLGLKVPVTILFQTVQGGRVPEVK